MSQSLPNQVNDFNDLVLGFSPCSFPCRNPFQTRSTTSIPTSPIATGKERRVAIPSKPGQRLQFFCPTGQRRNIMKSQSLPNQVNDFNNNKVYVDEEFQGVAIPSKPGQRLQSLFAVARLAMVSLVAIPSKPGQRLQSLGQAVHGPEGWIVAIPSKPGQRLQFQMEDDEKKRLKGVAIPSKPGQRLQSGLETLGWDTKIVVAIPSKPGQRLQSGDVGGDGAIGLLSQSLPNQVNDFNSPFRRIGRVSGSCRNPFQTRSTTSMFRAPVQRLTFPPGRNPFQTRSTTSINCRLSGNRY